MIDKLLEVAYQQEKRASIQDEMAAAFMHWPVAELKKIASGELKLACFDHDGESWIDKFQGTPLHDQALALEEEKLQLDIQDQQKRAAEREERNALWDAQDAIRLKRKMLELELRKGETGDATAQPSDVPTENLPESDDEPEETKQSAVNYFYGLHQAELDKLAAIMRSDMKKEALSFGALKSGLQSAGRFLGQRAQGAAKTFQAGLKRGPGAWETVGRGGQQVFTQGAGSVGQGLKNVGTHLGKQLGVGAQRAGQWIAKNPQEAALLGGGALAGTAALGAGAGYAAGR